ncbi:MAG TPA: redox-regulated ATPase YchF [Thermoanaerobaculaceae bacterium]|nr:redox-regulated ATPase YchF [Thermoanaerobaculaceae bacterium]
MEFGIVGLELSGKTTLFSLLTGHDPGAAHGKGATHVGIAQVPDPRLDRLSALFKPRKHTPATVRFVDVPGIAKGGAASLNLPELRTMDGLAVVIRGFESELVPHPEGSVDPARDLELLETELLLSDLAVATNRLDRLGRELGKRRAPELEAERDVLTRCRAALEGGTPLRRLGLSAEERRLLKGFTFLSLKPMLVVLNAGEPDAADLAGAVARSGLAPRQDEPDVAVSAVCATLEEEISRLAAADQASFLADLGLPDRALDRLLRAAYALLGLISFLTAGDDECRAWSIPAGTPAVKAAGAIHSDFERGFIRAEVVPWEQLLEAGSFAACRARGVLRLEGKDYVVADGDVITFRFNV